VTKADKRVAAVAAVVWTPEVTTAWQKKIKALEESAGVRL
jgi:hypothetical protein